MLYSGREEPTCKQKAKSINQYADVYKFLDKTNSDMKKVIDKNQL